MTVTLGTIAKQALQAKVLTLQQEAEIQAVLWEEEMAIAATDDRIALMALIVAVRAGEVRKTSRLFRFSDSPPPH